jgi:hypothetical protein
MSGFFVLVVELYSKIFLYLIVMKKTDLIYPLEIIGKIKNDWSDGEFKHAVKKFRQNAPSAPIPRLYEAYKWLKEQHNAESAESEKHFTNFIEIFLRILEERNASGTEVYSEVLRDSAEYKYLKGLFHNDDNEPAHESLTVKTPEAKPAPIPAIKKISLKNILSKKNTLLSDIDINEWHKLVEDHFKSFHTEELFVKNCSSVINNIRKRTEKEPYHIEIIVVYAFDRLLSCKTLSLKSKDFSMQILNMMIDRGEIWTALHKEYLEIIRR